MLCTIQLHFYLGRWSPIYRKRIQSFNRFFLRTRIVGVLCSLKNTFKISIFKYSYFIISSIMSADVCSPSTQITIIIQYKTPNIHLEKYFIRYFSTRHRLRSPLLKYKSFSIQQPCVAAYISFCPKLSALNIINSRQTIYI